MCGEGKFHGLRAMFQTELGKIGIWMIPNQDSYFVKYAAHTASLPIEQERSLAKTQIGGVAKWSCDGYEGLPRSHP